VGEVASSNLVVPTVYFQSFSFGEFPEWVQLRVRNGSRPFFSHDDLYRSSPREVHARPTPE
jgi:hypothetical protein